jgi:hypothetical protein
LFVELSHGSMDACHRHRTLYLLTPLDDVSGADSRLSPRSSYVSSLNLEHRDIGATESVLEPIAPGQAIYSQYTVAASARRSAWRVAARELQLGSPSRRLTSPQRPSNNVESPATTTSTSQNGTSTMAKTNATAIVVFGLTWIGSCEGHSFASQHTSIFNIPLSEG